MPTNMTVVYMNNCMHWIKTKGPRQSVTCGLKQSNKSIQIPEHSALYCTIVQPYWIHVYFNPLMHEIGLHLTWNQ